MTGSDVTSSSPADDPDLRVVAEALRRDADAVAWRAARRLHDEVPEASIDPLTFEETRRAARATLLALLDGWRRGTPLDAVPPPPELVFQVAIMARDGIGLEVLLRILQLAHATFADVWDEYAAATAQTPERQVRAMRLAHQLTFGWFGGLTRQLTEAYAAERERLARMPDAERRAAVDSALSGRASNVDALSRAAVYEFRRHHVALVLWRGAPAGEGVPAAADDQPVLAALADAVAAALGAGPPLVVAAASSVAWAWVGLREPRDPATVRAALAGALAAGDERTRMPAGAGDSARGPVGDGERVPWVAAPPAGGISIAAGEVAAGLEGFRRTHGEALAAFRVATLRADAGRDGVVAFGDVELVALLSEDPARARRFVARRLGALAAADPRAATLRRTLGVFLAEHQARGPTAERLGVHPNTATARARAAEALLPAGALEAPVEVQVALALAEVLG